MAALKECGRARDLESVKRIHAEAVERGCDSDVYVGTMLVDVYGKCRRVVEARAVFDQMPERNVVSWNAMMWAYAQMEDGEEAMRLYRRMAQEGVAPTDRTFVAALKACCCSASGCSLVSGNEGQPAAAAAGVLKQVREVHWDMVKRSPRSLSAVYVGTMLVDAYAKCGSLVEARQVFDGMPHCDVVCWNVMILGYAQLEDGGKALELYAQMQASGVEPDERTFVAALKACCCCWSSVPLAAAAECQVRAIHSQVVKRGKGAETDVFVGTMLVDAYVKCGNLEAARRVFDAMPHRNVVSWTAMIWGYAHREEGEEALQLYWRMQEEGVAPDDRALVAALKACGSWLPAAGAGGACAARMRQCLERVRRIHSDMGSVEKRGWDVFVGNMLVDVYAKCGSLVDARRVFEAMPRRDVVSWTCIISGYAQMEDGATALQLFERMQEEEGVVPDARTFVGALKACSAVAGLDMGRRIHGRIIAQSRSGDLDLVLASSLIDMYCRCGSMAEAQQVFDALPGRARGDSGAVCVWRALIAGYARQGDSDRVFHLLHLMLEQGEQQRKQQQQQQEGTSSSSVVSVLAPDGAVWLSVLAVCSHAGLLEQGLSAFRAMMAHSASASSNMDIGGEHYACVVDLLGRAGRLHDALAVARAAAAGDGDGDGAVWRAVLSACRQWGDVEIGREAFRRAVEADQGDAAAYVLMANVYAAAGMWEEARRVQAARMKVGSWKQPGQSHWTDAYGGVHVFGVGGAMGMAEQQQQQLEVRLEVVYPQLHRLQAKMLDA